MQSYQLFLFQTGAIKSHFVCFHVGSPLSGFYSKLVRLKGYLGSPAWLPAGCFYSKLVRLKGIKRRTRKRNRQSFYSKLVRLKVSLLYPASFLYL